MYTRVQFEKKDKQQKALLAERGQLKRRPKAAQIDLAKRERLAWKKYKYLALPSN